MRRLTAVGLALVVAGCGDTSSPPPKPTPTATPTATHARIAIAPQDARACAVLYARLQRVTVALSSGSALLAQSENEGDLSARIATEQAQLERSARLMAAGVVPAPLAATNRSLVAALRAFARDFARAKAPAKRGDLQAAVAAMTDQAVVDRVLTAAQKIEDACRP